VWFTTMRLAVKFCQIQRVKRGWEVRGMIAKSGQQSLGSGPMLGGGPFVQSGSLKGAVSVERPVKDDNPRGRDP